MTVGKMPPDEYKKAGDPPIALLKTLFIARFTTQG